METMALGTLTVGILIISFCFLYYKKPFPGGISGIAAMCLSVCTGYQWKQMLAESGKNTALLGFERYPAAPVILGILAFSAAGSIVASVIWIVRKCQNKG